MLQQFKDMDDLRTCEFFSNFFFLSIEMKLGLNSKSFLSKNLI